jgi:hypothetical protein
MSTDTATTLVPEIIDMGGINVVKLSDGTTLTLSMAVDDGASPGPYWQHGLGLAIAERQDGQD